MSGDRPVSGEWRNNWRLVAAGSAGMFVTIMPTSAISVFIQPLEAEFGWSRTAITSAAAMTMLVAAIFSPPLARMIERYGARGIGLAGMAITPLLFAAVSLVDGEIWTYLLLWFLISCGIAAGGAQPWTTVVSKAFSKSRGLALGFTIAGASFAGIVTAPIAAHMLDQYGWREAHLYMGLATFAIFVPITLWLVRVRRDPAEPAASSPAASADAVSGGVLTPGTALRSRLFWQLQAGLFVGCLIVTGIAINFIPMLTSRGLSMTNAAYAMSFLGMGAFVGKFIVGWAMDRMSPPLVVGTTRLFGAASAIILLFADHSISMEGACLAGVIAGIGIGGEIPLTAFMSARYFAMTHFARLYGWTFAGNRIASGVGPLCIAMMFDFNGDYMLALAGSAVLLLLSAVSIFTLESFWDAALPVVRAG